MHTIKHITQYHGSPDKITKTELPYNGFHTGPKSTAIQAALNKIKYKSLKTDTIYLHEYVFEEQEQEIQEVILKDAGEFWNTEALLQEYNNPKFLMYLNEYEPPIDPSEQNRSAIHLSTAHIPAPSRIEVLSVKEAEQYLEDLEMQKVQGISLCL